MDSAEPELKISSRNDMQCKPLCSFHFDLLQFNCNNILRKGLLMAGNMISMIVPCTVTDSIATASADDAFSRSASNCQILRLRQTCGLRREVIYAHCFECAESTFELIRSDVDSHEVALDRANRRFKKSQHRREDPNRPE